MKLACLILFVAAARALQAAPTEIEALLPAVTATTTPASGIAAADGAELYLQHCALCHGAEGRGIAGVFPPLAGSDFLLREREKTLRAPLEGLSGPIEVNGVAYQGAMPPVALSDEQLVAVFSHIFSSWGNRVLHPTRDEIAAMRVRTKFPTYEKMLAAFGTGQPPAPPEGWQWLPGVELNFSPVRLAAHPDGERVLILAENGDVWSWRSNDTAPRQMLAGTSYLDASLGRASVLGITVDRTGRLYLSSNQRNLSVRPVRNEVTIYRTNAWIKDQPWSEPAPWLRTAYSFGVGPYNHGVSHLSEGPDGMIYVNSGARTDGGEAGTSPDYATTGEEPNTACLWRLNPADENPAIEVFARGLRNTFGFCWDSEGRLLGAENGPDADAPEELNVIEQGRHYGFPFVFANWKEKAYPHTPDAPPGLTFTAPLRNLGPDAGGSVNGLSTFDPHSCPTGIVYLGRDWPAPLGGTFLTARFGNFLKGADVGFDVVQLKPDFAVGTTTAKRLAGPLGRPIDLLKLSGHRLVIAEYCRATTCAAGTGTPGRLLVLAPKPPVTTPPPPPQNTVTSKSSGSPDE